MKSHKELNLNDILKNIGKKKDTDTYLRFKQFEFSEIDTKKIIQNFLDNLLKNQHPSFFLNEYLKLSILKKVFLDLYKLTLTLHDPVYHPEKDMMGLNTVWGHTLIALDISKKISVLNNLNLDETKVLLLSTLLHDIGKPEVTEWEFKRGRMVVTSVFHDSKGVSTAEKFLNMLNISDEDHFPFKTIILKMVKNHHRIYELYKNMDSIKLNSISRLRRDMLGYEKLLIFLDFSDRRSRKPFPLKFKKLDSVSEWILKKREAVLMSESKPKPLIMGRDILYLGKKPGKEIGILVSELYKKQLAGEFFTKEEGIKILKDILL